MKPDEQTLDDIKRLTARRRKGIAAVWGAAASPVAMIAFQTLDVSAGWKNAAVVIGILACIFLAIYGALVCTDTRIRLRELVCAVFVPDALNRAFTRVEYDHEKAVPTERLDAALANSHWHDANGNDYVSAEYRGMSVEFSNMRLSREISDRDKENPGTRSKTVFCGQWFVCGFSAGFPAELLIIRRGIHLLRPKPTERMKPIESGDERLDKRFELFADDPDGALAILTPRAMDAILRLDSLTAGRCGLKLARDGTLTAAVNSDRFIFTPSKKPEESACKIAEDVRYVTEILDTLRDISANTQ